MTPVLGIDLGTTNSCAATVEAGTPKVLDNAEGGRTTPSVVAFHNGELLVGSVARRQRVLNPSETFFSVKRFMGRKVSEVDSERQNVPYTLTAGENDAVRLVAEGTEYAPEQISAFILQKLKTDAEAKLGAPVADAVITVPAYFNDAQRTATRDAASIAGLNVLRIINEPTAAALAFGFDASKTERDASTLLVFDLGGGTFDVSVLEISDGLYEVKATGGDNHLGGDDFDRLIVDKIAADFMLETGTDLRTDPAALQRLYEAAEKAKVELSSTSQTHISLPFIATEGGPAHLETVLTRAQLNELCAPLLDRLRDPVAKAISDAMGKGVKAIDKVLLVGGMTRVPAVQEVVEEITGVKPLRTVNPDEAVAMGAALQAAALTGDVDDVLLLDVIPLTLGIETKGGLFTPLIDANTTIPARVSETFTTAEDSQATVEVHILQGERMKAMDNRSLGKLVLENIPQAAAGVPQIQVTFDISTDGILQVSAIDLGTENSQELRVDNSTSLDPGEVDRMRAEALRFADADQKEREFIEARNGAEVTRDRGKRQLRDNAERMTDTEREAIELNVEVLSAAIDAADTEGGAAHLRAAADALTEAMQAFAERLYAEPSQHLEDIHQRETEHHEVELAEEAVIDLPAVEDPLGATFAQAASSAANEGRDGTDDAPESPAGDETSVSFGDLLNLPTQEELEAADVQAPATPADEAAEDPAPSA